MTDNFQYMANEDIIRTITGTETNVMTSEGINNSFARLARMDEQELMQIKGIGKKKARQIMASIELGKRLYLEKHTYNDLGSSIALYQHLRPRMEFLETETAYLVVMNHSFKEIKTIKISEGGQTETAIDIREIMRHTLINRGTIIAIAHNHPSGNPAPSKRDNILTAQIAKACEIMRIFFMDHIIIGEQSFYSYYDKGKL